ncbi:MAG: glutamyl-tRNA reductase [Methanotrichaceae archaeon]|nr:glutamyl-tRNA reductase [Methanotrichaceae archaeon]
MSKIASMLVTHRKASIEEIERAWHGDVATILSWVKSQDQVEECAVLKTCNRVEIYVVSPKGEKVLFDLAKKARVSSRIIDFYDHDESVLHLLRVASGLESMVLGEDQILGQIKDLYHMAKKAGTIGWLLETALKKSIQVGKRVRKETRINERSVSVGSASVDLAEEILGDLKGKTVMVIGAGETGELITKALHDKGVDSFYVTNRTFSSAQSVAESLGGIAIPFEEMKSHLRVVDLVISATSAPHYILLKSDIEKAMADRLSKLLIIDIANPRDVEEAVSQVHNVELHNIDGLKCVSSENMRQRMAEIEKVEAIIGEEYELLKAKYKRKQAEELLALLYSQAEAIKEQEVRKAMNKLSFYHTLGEIEQQVLSDMSHSIVNKLLAEPTKSLKNAAEKGDVAFLKSALELFRLGGTL